MSARSDLDEPIEALSASATPTDDEIAARAALARPAIAAAVAIGIVGDALLRLGLDGLGFPIWISIGLTFVVSLAWRRGDQLRAEQIAWMVGAIAFASVLAWRDAEMLLVFNVLATVVCLAMLGMTLAGSPVSSLFEARVRDLIHVAARTIADGAGRAVPLVLRDADWPSLAAKIPPHRATPFSRAAIITIPLIVVFGALLRSADPMFGALIRLPAIDAEIVVSHVVLFGVLAWISAGWFRGVIVAPPPRSSRPDFRPVTLGSIEITIALGAVATLFALFVAVQMRWLFGGEEVVRQTTGLGYAEYARSGFFELLWVAMLTLPLLLGANASIAESDRTARRRLQRIGLVIIVLLGAIVASALGRMALYIRFYGLSADRVYATAIMIWIAVVLAWLALTVLRGRPTTFATGMLLSALAVVSALNLLSPERMVTRVNLARGPVAVRSADGSSERIVDLPYLASLGAESVPSLVPALLRPSAVPQVGSAAEIARCRAAQSVLNRWADSETGQQTAGWRHWNLSRSRARSVVRRHERALRAIVCPPRPTTPVTPVERR